LSSRSTAPLVAGVLTCGNLPCPRAVQVGDRRRWRPRPVWGSGMAGTWVRAVERAGGSTGPLAEVTRCAGRWGAGRGGGRGIAPRRSRGWGRGRSGRRCHRAGP